MTARSLGHTSIAVEAVFCRCPGLKIVSVAWPRILQVARRSLFTTQSSLSEEPASGNFYSCTRPADWLAVALHVNRFFGNAYFVNGNSDCLHELWIRLDPFLFGGELFPLA